VREEPVRARRVMMAPPNRNHDAAYARHRRRRFVTLMFAGEERRKSEMSEDLTCVLFSAALRRGSAAEALMMATHVTAPLIAGRAARCR